MNRKIFFLFTVCGFLLGNLAGGSPPQRGERKVKARVQERPGGEVREVEMAVHPVPVNPPVQAAEGAPLQDDDLVLGVVIGGRARAYPIRYLALTEVVDDELAGVGLAPTW